MYFDENIFVRSILLLLFLLFHYTMHILLGAFHNYVVALSPVESIMGFAVDRNRF